MKVICKVCNKEFNVNPSLASTAKFCSIECRDRKFSYDELKEIVKPFKFKSIADYKVEARKNEWPLSPGAYFEKRGIDVGRDKPLHSLVGEYIKALKAQGLIESEMTERILKSSISVMEAFNRVRNEQSFAHDNNVLNYAESMLIFGHVSSSIRFIKALEEKTEASTGTNCDSDSDLPF